MHKLLLARLFLAGMLTIGVTGAAQAMQPASSADLRGCLGLYVGNSCTVLGGCIPNTGTAPCGPGNTGASCVNNSSGEFQNFSCGAPAVINGCTGIDVGYPCTKVLYGTCVFDASTGYSCMIQQGTAYMWIGYFTSCHY